MTDERVAWLTSCLDELCDLATRVKARYTTRGPYAENPGTPFWPASGVRAKLEHYDDPDMRAGLDLIEAFGPDVVLARVKADRCILNNHCPVESESNRIVCQTCDSFWVGQWPCPTFTALLSAYQYRPGFHKEWLR